MKRLSFVLATAVLLWGVGGSAPEAAMAAMDVTVNVTYTGIPEAGCTLGSDVAWKCKCRSLTCQTMKKPKSKAEKACGTNYVSRVKCKGSTKTVGIVQVTPTPTNGTPTRSSTTNFSAGAGCDCRCFSSCKVKLAQGASVSCPNYTCKVGKVTVKVNRKGGSDYGAQCAQDNPCTDSTCEGTGNASVTATGTVVLRCKQKN